MKWKFHVRLCNGIISYERKPSSQGLIQAADFFGVGLQEIIYIGDSLEDGLAAKNANIEFFAVLSGNTSATDFVKQGWSVENIYPTVNNILEKLGGAIENTVV